MNPHNIKRRQIGPCLIIQGNDNDEQALEKKCIPRIHLPRKNAVSTVDLNKKTRTPVYTPCEIPNQLERKTGYVYLITMIIVLCKNLIYCV